jgi:hypothetical protein
MPALKKLHRHLQRLVIELGCIVAAGRQFAAGEKATTYLGDARVADARLEWRTGRDFGPIAGGGYLPQIGERLF